MAKLSTKARKELPAKSFAGPGRSYPIEDIEHGRKAIQLGARSVKKGNLAPATYANIKSKVRSKFPSIGKKSGVKLSSLT
jgi:hypothetical protein